MNARGRFFARSQPSCIHSSIIAAAKPQPDRRTRRKSAVQRIKREFLTLMADIIARVVRRKRAGKSLSLAQPPCGKNRMQRASVIAHGVCMRNHRHGDFGNAAAHGEQTRVKLGFLAGDRIGGPAAAGSKGFGGNHQRAAEFRHDALLRAVKVIFVSRNDFSAAHIEVFADTAHAVISMRSHRHQCFFYETGTELHIAVQKEKVFAAGFLCADKTSKPRCRVLFREQIAARAERTGGLQALVGRTGIDVNHFVGKPAKGGADAV